jgi:AraC-like DNA-binding protein
MLEPAVARISVALTQRLNHTLRLMEAPGPSHGLALSMEQLLVSTGKELSRSRLEAPQGRGLDEERCGMVDRMRQSLVREVSGEESAPDLTTLFRKSGLSRFQALRLFRRHYGITPYAYQLHFRIAHAKRSLRGGAPLAQVAANYGFVDQSHFTRHFKRLVGVTPGQYARSR